MKKDQQKTEEKDQQQPGRSRPGADEQGASDAGAESATGMFLRPAGVGTGPVGAETSGEDMWGALTSDWPPRANAAAAPKAGVRGEPSGPIAGPAQQPERSSAGEFTQLFQSSTPQPRGSAPQSPPEMSRGRREDSPAAVPPAAPANAGPGDFTRIFQQITRPAPPEPRVDVGPSPSQAGSQPGDFTRLMQSFGSSQEAEVTLKPFPPSRGPEGKVRGFSSPGGNDSASGSAGAPPRPPEVFREVSGRGPESPALPYRQPPGGSPPPPRSEPNFGPNFGPSFERPTATFSFRPRPPIEPSPSEQGGGFTQLFQALNAAEPGLREPGLGEPEAQPFSRPAPPAAGAEPAPGGFTQLMRSLSADAPPGESALPGIGRSSAQPQPAAPVTPGPDEPGDFTRIISRPTTPEGAPTGKASAPPASPAAGQPLSAPVIPKPPLPVAASIPPAAGAAFGAGKFAFPPPAVPAATPPEPPAAAASAPQSKLQEYLPILLILNGFLLLVLVLLVVMALRRH